MEEAIAWMNAMGYVISPYAQCGKQDGYPLHQMGPRGKIEKNL